MKKLDLKKLRTLLFGTMYVSAFTFGGGFVIVTFLKRKFVDELHWLTEEQMLDITALAQSSPGAIAVNAAILIGWQTAGFAGMVTAVLGTIFPPMAILTAIFFCYDAFAANRYVALMLRGMQAGVAAVILNVVLDLGRSVAKEKSALSWVIMIAAFLGAWALGINVIFIILAAALAGILRALWMQRQEGSK